MHLALGVRFFAAFAQVPSAVGRRMSPIGPKRTLTTVAHRDLDFMSTHLVLPDDDLRADIYPVIQIDHIIVDETKAAG